MPPRPPTPGQLALVDVMPVPRLLRAEHPTGVQAPCSPCVAAGRDELGLPRFADDPTPLCLTCWRRRERETGRRGTAPAEPIEWVEELPATCPVCGPDAPQAAVDLPTGEAVEAAQKRRQREERRRREGKPEPRTGCWLCGDAPWLAEAEVDHERWLAEQQAAVDAEFERLTARAGAEARVVWLTGWVSRLRDVLAAYTDPDRRGGEVSVRWGRAVELLADVLARDAAARADSSGRGRPPAFRFVAAVMAVDADFRSGRRAMPGRAECAELAGVCERAVYSAWKRGVAIGAWIRTTPGRRLTLAERMATGRGNDRAVYDLRPVNRSADPVARDAMVPAALGVLDEVLDWGVQLLAAAEHDLDAHDAPVRGTGRAPDADTLLVRAGRVRLRQAVARTRTATTVLTGHLDTANKCTPHMVSKGECVSSCLGVSTYTLVNRRNLGARQRPRRGRGKSDIGASRSPMRSGSADLESRGPSVGRPDGTPPVDHHRTLYTVDGASPTVRKEPRKRPEWADWAYTLAYELRKHWTWLQGQPVLMVASSLGSRLGPRWTAAAVVDLVEQDRAGRALPVKIHTPINLLQDLLEHALTDERRQPPFPARLHTEHQQRLADARRAATVAAAEARRAAHAAAAAAHAARVQAATALHAAGGGGLAAAGAAAAAARRSDPGAAARIAADRAELAQLSAASRGTEPDEHAETAWPTPREAGSGPRGGQADHRPSLRADLT